MAMYRILRCRYMLAPDILKSVVLCTNTAPMAGYMTVLTAAKHLNGDVKSSLTTSVATVLYAHSHITGQ
jgi:hypothetical protein